MRRDAAPAGEEGFCSTSIYLPPRHRRHREENSLFGVEKGSGNRHEKCEEGDDDQPMLPLMDPQPLIHAGQSGGSLLLADPVTFPAPTATGRRRNERLLAVDVVIAADTCTRQRGEHR